MPFFKDVKLLRAVCCWGMRFNGMRMDKFKREVYGWLVRGEDAAVGCTSIVYVVMFCASRDHKSWQGVASHRDATRKGVEQLTRKSFSIHFSRALPIFFDSVR